MKQHALNLELKHYVTWKLQKTSVNPEILVMKPRNLPEYHEQSDEIQELFWMLKRAEDTVYI